MKVKLTLGGRPGPIIVGTDYNEGYRILISRILILILKIGSIPGALHFV